MHIQRQNDNGESIQDDQGGLDMGLLTPEMCEGGKAFSRYAADLWAANVCLYILL